MTNRHKKFNSTKICLIGIWVSLVILHQIYPVRGIDCGTVSVVYDLIGGGNETPKGAWPFVVVLQQLSKSETICGGTLISNKHVLTGNKLAAVLLLKTKFEN